MMKKPFIIILCCILSISLSACRKETNKVKPIENIGGEVSTSNTSKSDAENTELSNLSDNQSAGYTVTNLISTNSDAYLKYTIKYPQISGLSDSEKEKKINNLLKDEALKVLNYYENPYGSVELNIDYEIVLINSGILSVQYWGSGMVSNAAHPNSLFFTTNIDIENGEKLRLKDVINIDNNFAKQFLNGKFMAVQSEKGEVLQQLSIEEIIGNFEEADSLDYIGTEKQADVFSYFTEDSFGISISVGHALGDHAEFEINYHDLDDKDKTENTIWMSVLK